MYITRSKKINEFETKNYKNKTALNIKICETAKEKKDMKSIQNQSGVDFNTKTSETQLAFKEICNIDNCVDKVELIDVNPKLPSVMAEKFRKMIEITYLEKQTEEVPDTNYKARIVLSSNTPTFCKARRLSFGEKNEVNNIIEDLLKKGIIRHSNSPYASPIVLTKKKSGATRMCVDYRNLNKLIARDNYPLPLIEDCLEYLGVIKFFSFRS